MHRFLHGIRRSSCWPVVSPLAFARLTSPLPFPILKQPCGYGDLLQSGVDYEGDLLPQSGDANDEGDLLPNSGDEADGEGIPPSQGNEQAVLCDLQPQIDWQLSNILGILSPKSNGLASALAAVLHEAHACSAIRCCSVKALQHDGFMKMFEANAVLMLSLPMAQTFVFDPGGASSLHEQVHEDMLPGMLDGLNSINRRSSVVSSDVLMKMEQLNYIFDHDNKSNYSRRQYDSHSMRDSNIPRPLLNSAKYQQNLLPFDCFDISNAAQIRRVPALGSSDSSSIQASNNDKTLHAAADHLRNKSMKTIADPYELEAGESITGRQRALLEFLSKELARFRAFHELAAKETANQNVLQMQRIHHRDVAILSVENNLSSSRKIKGKYESPQIIANHRPESSDNRLNHPASINALSISRMRHKLGAPPITSIDDIYFLIPLRGRRCDQWNDEVKDEDVAALKTKLWMKMHMRLLYITKDLLDPG